MISLSSLKMITASVANQKERGSLKRNSVLFIFFSNHVSKLRTKRWETDERKWWKDSERDLIGEEERREKERKKRNMRKKGSADSGKDRKKKGREEKKGVIIKE